MRFIHSYFLVLLYISTVFGQLIPVVKDTLSHTFAEAIHIATVHAIYGSNHMSKEIEESARTDKKASVTKYFENSDVHTKSDEFSHSLPPFPADRNFCRLVIEKFDLIAISKQSPPPKFSC